jgi:HlyD family secretion protein
MTGTELLRLRTWITWVEVDVNENDIVKIKVGDEANVEVDALKRSSKEWLRVFQIQRVAP